MVAEATAATSQFGEEKGHSWAESDSYALECYDDQAVEQQLALSCVGESRACVGKTQLHAASIAEEFAEQAAAVSVVDAFGRVCVVGTLAGLGCVLA